MKVHTSLMELIFIMAMMVASIPLLGTLLRTCNSTKMDYLKDKTIYKISDSVQWETRNIDGKNVLIPSTLAPISIDYGGAQVIAVINDEYCPDDGRRVYYSYNTDSVFMSHNANSSAMLEIVKSWKVNRDTYWGAQLGRTVNGNNITSLDQSKLGSKCYIVWSAADRRWVITNQFVNVYEIK